jgi:hypothetical protein
MANVLFMVGKFVALHYERSLVVEAKSMLPYEDLFADPKANAMSGRQCLWADLNQYFLVVVCGWRLVVQEAVFISKLSC